MALITAQYLSAGGNAAPSFSAATASGDSFVLNHEFDIDRVMIIAKNTHTAAQDVTVKAKRKNMNDGLDDLTTEIPLTDGEKWIKPGPHGRTYISSDREVFLEYPDGVTGLTIAVVVI